VVLKYYCGICVYIFSNTFAPNQHLDESETISFAVLAIAIVCQACRSQASSLSAEEQLIMDSSRPSDPRASAAAMTDTSALQTNVAVLTGADTALYESKLNFMINGDASGKWPVKTGIPLPGSILPYKTVVAFYGNLYSKGMGILGELPRPQMLNKLKTEIKRWQAADSTIEIQPALHYIAVTAQQSPGKGGKYRLRMPFHQIDSVLSMAKEINAIVFLDIQVGLSTLQSEVPEFEKYLKMPNVHLGIDPEFAMKNGNAPGKAVGNLDAADINYTSGYLARLVKENNIPPKILVVHRFTQNMVTNYRQIKLQPEVQIVMHMDGWGEPARKIGTYKNFICREPVEYTGFKLFYKNDVRSANGRMMDPADLLALKPRPVYVQYQ
jgi:hypothetical protein